MIDFEIIWLEETEDTRRELERGFLVPTRVVGVTVVRKRNLDAACAAAANKIKKMSEPRGFVVRRKRDV